MSPTAVPAIGERLRKQRVRRGITVRGLARDIGVSASLISQIETDKSQPSVSTLYAITTALGISIEELFDVDGSGARPEAGADGHRERGLLTAAPGLAAVPGPGVPGAIAAQQADEQQADEQQADEQQADEQQAEELVTVAGAGDSGRIPDVAAALRLRRIESERDRRVGPVVRAAEREMLTLDSGVVWERLGQVPGTHVDFLRITYQPGGTSSSSGQLMRHPGTEYGHLISGELVLTLAFDEYRLVSGDSVSFNSTSPHGYRNEGTEPAVGIWFVLERLD
jgi:transcriptional regulator with XRE-family HTH domain/quercetin dioxygenase-like cupin family protein